MFSFNKTVVCVEFSKNSIFCALAQISGRKVDIIAIDNLKLENGILEEGVIYDVPHLQQLVKNLITSVSKSQSKIDSAWIAIPDNKVSITKFEVEKDKKGINEYQLHKAIEEKFNFSASKLYLINQPIHELNRKVFYLSDAIRIEHLQPFLQLFEPLNIPVEAVFPTFNCIYEDLKDQFTTPTLLLYPGGKGFKFFLADSNGVHMESVWGHNIIEFNDNFDKAIDEVIQYARNSREIALVVRRIMVIENPGFNADLIQTYLQRTGVEFNWISPDSNEENAFDPISIIILKGLIKSSMGPTATKGFLEPQLTHATESKSTVIPPLRPTSDTFSAPGARESQRPSYQPNYSTPVTKSTIVRNSDYLESKWNWKVILASTLLGLALIGLLGYAGKKVSDRIGSKVTPGTALITPTPTLTSTPTITATSTPTVTATPVATATPTVTPTPTVANLTKSQVFVQVLNGNNKTGEASRISGILQRNGFKTRAAANNPTRNIETTVVYYKDARAQKLAEEIVGLIEPTYPSAKATFDSNSRDDIVVVLGAK